MSYNLYFCFSFFIACTCDTLGTEGNRGCDKGTGNCICKRFVTGRNCDRCYVSKTVVEDQYDLTKRLVYIKIGSVLQAF